MSKAEEFLHFIVILLFSAVVFSGCVREDEFAQGDYVRLKFSSDTITFDTVFTTVGSVTKKLMVYNTENESVKIDRICLVHGANSYYRLNVDGSTDLVVKDVEIAAKDSMFIFVRTEINPNNLSNPLLIYDSIAFHFNEKAQYVRLEAYGQDAYFHKPDHFLLSLNTQTNRYDTIRYSLAHQNCENRGIEVEGNQIYWKTDKPHVILGVCAVDSAYTLNLGSNARLYFDKNSEFWVYNAATLKAEADREVPVVFQGMRLDEYYYNVPSQWNCIRFMAGSKDNVLDNVVIKNNIIGLIVDTCVNSSPTLTISNTRIENCSNIGLYARGAKVEGKNVIVQNCGSYAVALTLGGSYEFIHCTFANYWNYSTRTDACLILNDYYVDVYDAVQYREIERANFHNCIIYGSLSEDEIEFDLLNGNVGNIYFGNCLLKYGKWQNYSSIFTNCIFNQSPLFVDASNGDVSLQSTSPAIGRGDGVWSYTVPYDINGMYRNDPPCIGALEYVPSTDRRAFGILKKKRK